MTIAETLASGALVFLAIAHSALGEAEILKPLFAANWDISSVPRLATERILRFAWHLTSLAWIALALIVADVPVLATVGVMMLVSAALVFVMLRGHLAWPVFLLGGLGALHAYSPLPAWVLVGAAAISAAVLIGAGGLHAWWALGGTWGLDAALPEAGDDHNFQPGPRLTMAVAVLLTATSGIVIWVSTGAPELVRWAAMGAAAVFTVRAIGDTKVAGFSKTVRGTKFAEADDRIFTPLCVGLALGTTAALMI